MTSADLQWSEVDIPVGAVDESIDPRLLPPGQLISAVNCEFSSKEQSPRKRPGLSLSSARPIGASGNSLEPTRLATHDLKNQLLAIDLKGDSGSSPGMYQVPRDTSTTIKPTYTGAVSQFLVRRKPLMSDLQSDIITDSAYVNTIGPFGYMVYASVHFQSARINLKVVKVNKEGDAYDTGETIYDQDVSYNTGTETNAFWVRCAPCLDRYVLVTWGHVGGKIKGMKVDLGGATPSITTTGPTLLVTAKATTLMTDMHYHDTCESTKTDDVAGAPNWLLIYRSTAEACRVARIASNLTVTWDTVAEAACNPSGMSIFERGNTAWANYHSQPADALTSEWHFTGFTVSTGGISVGPVAWCTSADIGNRIAARGRCSAIGYATNSPTEVVLFHSQQYDPLTTGTVSSTAEVSTFTRWRRVRTNGSMDGLRQKYGIRLWSKPSRDRVDGKWVAWCGTLSQRSLYGSLSSGTVFGPVEWTGVLMRFAETAASEDLFTAQLVGSVGQSGLLAEPYSTTNSSGPWPNSAMTPQSMTHQAYTTSDDASDQVKLGRRCVLNLCYIPTERKSGPWEVTIRDNENQDWTPGYGRAQCTRMGGSVYFAGGLLYQFDGDRTFENNFIKAPWLSGRATTGGAGWGAAYTKWAEQHIYLQAVFETVLDNGEIVRSATSNILDIKLNGTLDVTPPDTSVVINVEPPTLRMQSYGSTRIPKTIVTLYGSAEPNGQTLYRWFPFEIYYANPTSDRWGTFVGEIDATTPISFTINGTAAPYGPPADLYYPNAAGVIEELQRHEIIYNDSGELDNDPPFGGCSCLASHKDRLWVAGGDDPEVVWYSKERVDGRPMEFSIGQQIRIPSSEVVALASLDDALIVFCRHAIFAVYGDGPNATGDGSSGFFTVVPISTTVGCNGPSSVVATPDGVMFRSEIGMYLLNRGRQLIPVPQVQDTIALSNVPVHSYVVPQKQQARFLVNYVNPTNDQETTDMLVYDWDAKKWATWRYTAFPVLGGATLGDSIYHIDGYILKEDPAVWYDVGFPYYQSLQWGWLSFGRLNGYKRLHKMGILMQPNTWNNYSADPSSFPFGLHLTLDLKWAESGYQMSRRWSSYELGQTQAYDGINLLNVHIGKTAPSIRVTLTEDEPVFRITGSDTSATVSTIGANALRVRMNNAAGYSILTVTSGAAQSKSTIAAELNTAIAGSALANYVRAYVNAFNQIVLETLKRDDDPDGDGFYRGNILQIDTVANGSTLNTPLGISAFGASGTDAVAVANQSGFAVQGLSFEVGHARGNNRLPALQSR